MDYNIEIENIAKLNLRFRGIIDELIKFSSSTSASGTLPIGRESYPKTITSIEDKKEEIYFKFFEQTYKLKSIIFPLISKGVLQTYVYEEELKSEKAKWHLIDMGNIEFDAIGNIKGPSIPACTTSSFYWQYIDKVLSPDYHKRKYSLLNSIDENLAKTYIEYIPK